MSDYPKPGDFVVATYQGSPHGEEASRVGTYSVLGTAYELPMHPGVVWVARQIVLGHDDKYGTYLNPELVSATVTTPGQPARIVRGEQ